MKNFEKSLTGPYLEPASGNKPESIIIFLHGLGADGNDLISLGKEWSALLPDTVFISPNAPQNCDFAPVGYQWFSLTNLDPNIMLEGAQNTAPLLNNYIDECLEHFQLTEDRLCIVGFSQGTMMALYVMPRRQKQCAGILGYSGMVLGPHLLEKETVSRPPCLLIHGMEDQIVPFWTMGMTEKAMKEAKFDVATNPRPALGHGIDSDGMLKGGEFLVNSLSISKSEAKLA